ncbi:MAG: fatty acid--CoA ligase family protein [Acidimicrobiales bacterium]
MNLLLLLDMAAAGGGDEVALQVGDDQLSAAELLSAVWRAGELVDGASAVAYVGTNGLGFPVGLFAAAAVGAPFVPLNYRLSDDQLDELLGPLGDVVIIAEGGRVDALAARGHRVLEGDRLVAQARQGSGAGEVPADAEHPAVLLHTSGTTSAPKAAVLRHRHLTSYVIGTVEFGAADREEAALVSVPPYHVAGLANLLSNLYLGRRIVYLRQFEAEEWVSTVRREGVTHAMVVPTMLARIADVLDADDAGLPSLRAISYGGSRTPSTVLQRIMDRLPEVAFTNAYGLTETSSTIAVLGPDDHRAARSGDPVAVGRLASVGRVLPTVEVQVREGDVAVAIGQPGEIWVRGEQVSGEYRGLDPSLDPEGWFPTRDRGWVDDEGYLFIEGRSDDTIIRGGENIAPSEIEEVLLDHPDVAQCAVVGVPDEEWGQRIAAAIVLEDGADADADGIRDFVRQRLRGSKTPDEVTFVDELPYTETGKLLRRVVLSSLLTPS